MESFKNYVLESFKEHFAKDYSFSDFKKDINKDLESDAYDKLPILFFFVGDPIFPLKFDAKINRLNNNPAYNKIIDELERQLLKNQKDISAEWKMGDYLKLFIKIPTIKPLFDEYLKFIYKNTMNLIEKVGIIKDNKVLMSRTISGDYSLLRQVLKTKTLGQHWSIGHRLDTRLEGGHSSTYQFDPTNHVIMVMNAYILVDDFKKYLDIYENIIRYFIFSGDSSDISSLPDNFHVDDLDDKFYDMSGSKMLAIFVDSYEFHEFEITLDNPNIPIRVTSMKFSDSMMGRAPDMANPDIEKILTKLEPNERKKFIKNKEKYISDWYDPKIKEMVKKTIFTPGNTSR